MPRRARRIPIAPGAGRAAPAGRRPLPMGNRWGTARTEAFSDGVVRHRDHPARARRSRCPRPTSTTSGRGSPTSGRPTWRTSPASPRSAACGSPTTALPPPALRQRRRRAGQPPGAAGGRLPALPDRAGGGGRSATSTPSGRPSSSDGCSLLVISVLFGCSGRRSCATARCWRRGSRRRRSPASRGAPRPTSLFYVVRDPRGVVHPAAAAVLYLVIAVCPCSARRGAAGSTRALSRRRRTDRRAPRPSVVRHRTSRGDTDARGGGATEAGGVVTTPGDAEA